ncbi:SDR family NAD(P)-dependent oxidoreductase [Peribacillus frigoritolerans]|uniref:SDR family NAD(P)-dependent oxidoreductase n=1 Tax=Peribacillus frigoritolerans TaxID=450367 RepID=UPI00289DF2AE|nr:SDR family NAD(P)-dependent oxidoreductase [Peribacillus frigoritolerans]
MDKTISHFEKVDILFSNAAIHFALKDFSDIEWDEFKPKLEEELKAAFITTKAVLPLMKKQKYRKLVYISSSLSHQPLPLFYCSWHSQRCAEFFIKYLAQELGAYNITANTLAPSMV